MAKGGIHEIVSNVDTIIILKNPAIRFAAWTEPVPALESLEDSEEASSDADKLPLTGVFSGEPEDELPESDSKQPNTLSIDQEETSNCTEPSLFGGLVSSAKPQIATPNDPGPGIGGVANGITYVKGAQAEVVPIEEEEIRYHVCSGNLMSASPWFNRAMNKIGWSESKRNREDGCFYVCAQDWDEEAFIIVLRIFHLQNDIVPEVVSLEMLAKISVIVHYYECASAVRMHFKIWISNLKRSIVMPSTYCRDLMLWICIAKTFSLHKEFKEMTLVAIKHCDEGELRTMGLPIVGPVVDEIEMRRSKSIGAIVAGLHDLLDSFRSSDYLCPSDKSWAFECGSILYGALTKGMHSMGIWSPFPIEPFTGLSLYDVATRARLMKSPTWLHVNSGYTKNSGYNHSGFGQSGFGQSGHSHSVSCQNGCNHNCSLGTQVSAIVNRVCLEDTGLDLQDYQEEEKKGNET